jgi:lipoprotein-anchoring transpeptidase ErfK/SrfK
MLAAATALVLSLLVAPPADAAPADTAPVPPAATGEAATVIEATASVASLVHGQSVVIRYTVTSDGAPLAGAATTVRYGGKTLPVTTDAAGRAALNVRDLPVGRAAAIIRYAGDDIHAPGSATLLFTVSPRPTAITELTPTAGTAVSGDSVIVRFLVSGAGKPLVGVLTAITVGGTTVWARSGADGRVARTVPILPVGRLSVLVRYFGDAAYDRATATTSLTVTNPCPAAAKACVDLANNVSWLQDGGVVSYGPVPITSGMPGHRTRPGTFRVYWKDKNHRSSLFNGAPMPNSLFFDGDIAFHAGSLVDASHGCIHLSSAASQEYWNRLHTGDVVYVWGTARY